jgi:hypothetical protein
MRHAWLGMKVGDERWGEDERGGAAARMAGAKDGQSRDSRIERGALGKENSSDGIGCLMRQARSAPVP